MTHLATLTFTHYHTIPLVRLISSMEESGEVIAFRRIPGKYPFRKFQGTIETTLREPELRRNMQRLVHPQYSMTPVQLEDLKIFRDPNDDEAKLGPVTKLPRIMDTEDLDFNRILVTLPKRSSRSIKEWETILVHDFKEFGDLEYITVYENPKNRTKTGFVRFLNAPDADRALKTQGQYKMTIANKRKRRPTVPISTVLHHPCNLRIDSEVLFLHEPICDILKKARPTGTKSRIIENSTMKKIKSPGLKKSHKTIEKILPLIDLDNPPIPAQTYTSEDVLRIVTKVLASENGLHK